MRALRTQCHDPESAQNQAKCEAMRTIIIGKPLSEISVFGQINYGQFLDCQRVIIIARIVCGKECPKLCSVFLF